ncbi:hypothetical protein ACFC51_06195 [Streptomyces sp. NPDC055962]|uniref:hypothetical protein n=1 Tax=Streptomyces sp. NPDC055962 TaxID=3345667 RepID=UPI0035DCC7AF
MRDLVRSVVRAVAPDELPLVEGLCRFDDATVTRRLSRKDARREPLGFGIGEVAALVTPIVWLVLDGMAQQIATSATNTLTERVTGRMRRLTRRSAPPAVVTELTREQMARVRAQVLAAARQRGFPAERGEELADAVVARLVLSDESDTPAPPTPDPPAEPGPTDPVGGQD